ncbi:hypothetical protein IMG5_169370 [Ichthyophthirius multifiliis]|uniref:2-oxoacid dehydrogenase acyltransferase catalytic domain-containing protein n=1 Tax=Ichthyophthirius multifiliis TaxID=5932 RepID=G0R1A7_ICHMU|nr:hypothetical protein IMG5_169370 [Ichthyophthirius multifiliis]EGR28740.1 hypothetical protein IMG5_169370 [Ichthyophthirius multifiliis]|eukprot:XP_004029976.1 hypothetical protein IMG5_169370 [Ichthyophthirius multifiliis]
MDKSIFYDQINKIQNDIDKNDTYLQYDIDQIQIQEYFLNKLKDLTQKPLQIEMEETLKKCQLQMQDNNKVDNRKNDLRLHIEQDLSALSLRNVDKKGVLAIQNEVNEKSKDIKNNKGGKIHQKQTRIVSFLPPLLISLAADILKFILYYLNIDFPLFSFQKNHFGGAHVTSVGSIGIDDAFVPYVNSTNVPMLIALGRVKEKPIVKNGKIEIAPIITCNFTIDHRFMDGSQAKSGQNAFKDFLLMSDQKLESD